MGIKLNKNQIAITKAADGKDGTRPILQCACIGKGYIVAADGFILARHPVEEFFEETVKIPAKDIQKAGVAKFAGVQFIQTNGTAARLLGKDDINSQVVEGTYPDYQQLIPTGKATLQVRLGAAVLKKLLACMGDNDYVGLEFTDGIDAPVSGAVRWRAGDADGAFMPAKW